MLLHIHMAQILLLSSFLLNFPIVLSAAVLQQSLQYSLSDAETKLRDIVGDELIVNPPPIAKACYDSGLRSSSACHNFNTTKRHDIWTSDQPGGYFYSNWASCQASGETCAFSLNTTDLPKSCSQGSIANLTIDIRSTDTLYRDVQAAFEYARVTKKPLVIKNTGHDWQGRSAAPDSLTLWTHRLQHTENSTVVPIKLEERFTPLSCSAEQYDDTVFHVGPGQQWGSLYGFAEEKELAVVGGTCPSVGIAGWLAGGGHSPMTPTYGMGVDNVRQVEIITPKHGIQYASPCHNTDLFRAVRGGGGATYGVISKITYKAIPRDEVVEFSYGFNFTNDTDIQDYFDILTQHAERWARKGWGGYIKSNTTGQTGALVLPKHSLDAARQDMTNLTDFLAQPHINGTTDFHAHPSWYKYFEVHLKDPKNHPAGWSAAVASRLLPSKAFSNNTHRKLVVDALSDLYKADKNMWLMLVTPSAFDHTTTSALHSSWKDAIWLVRANDRWDQYYDPATPDAARKHFEAIHAAFAGIRELAPGMGVSINEADIWEENREFAYWGNNYKELLDVKKEYDPENLLSVYGGVNWTLGDERYRCYPSQPQTEAANE